jgi:hypothetical protein
VWNTRNANDYVSQLQSLGAILAVPVREQKGSDPVYKIIRDLSARPVRLLDEDIGKLFQRGYFADAKPESVNAVMDILGLQLRPSHFVAFMPEELEQKIYDLEIAYLKQHHLGKTEDNIQVTKVRINRTDKGYEPEVIDQVFK